MTADLTLEELREKVGKGLYWLSEHDPLGHYHFRYEAKLLPSDRPAKNWGPEQVKEYRDYYAARTYWETLDALLTQREMQEATAG